MITLQDVSKTYAGERVLGPVDVELAAGGITALIGPNGAGKSTMLSIVGRLLDPTTGTVHVGGMDVRTTRSKELAKHLAILRQEQQVLARLSVRDLVGLGRFPHSGGRLTAIDRERVDETIAFLGLDELEHRYLDELSGGQRQRAFIGMVLAQDTEHVLLDEPLASLDMRQSVRTMRHLRRAADDLGRTIVIVLHDVNMAAAYADRVVGLRDGRVHASGTVDEIMRADVLGELFDTAVQVVQVGGRPTVVVEP